MGSYCGMYVLLNDDRHRFVGGSSKSALEIRDNIQDKIQSKKKSENFCWKIIFFEIKFLSEKNILEFCLGLHTAVVFRMQSFNDSFVVVYCLNSELHHQGQCST